MVAGCEAVTAAVGGTAGNPAVWVSRRWIVTCANGLVRNSWRYRPTGASSFSEPFSTSDITASVVPSGLVSEAMSKIRIDGHRGHVGNEPARAVRAMQENLVAAADQHHDAGNLARLNRLAGCVVHASEIRGLAHGCGRGAGEGHGQGQDNERREEGAGPKRSNHQSILAGARGGPAKD